MLLAVVMVFSMMPAVSAANAETASYSADDEVQPYAIKPNASGKYAYDGLNSEEGKIVFGALADTHLFSDVNNENSDVNLYRKKKFASFLNTFQKDYGSDVVVLDGDIVDTVRDVGATNAGRPFMDGTELGWFNRFIMGADGSGIYTEPLIDYSATKIISVMGNHEGSNSNAFENGTGCKIFGHYVVNGYHFISFSAGLGYDGVNNRPQYMGGNYDDQYGVAVPWLMQQLTAAKKDTPDKPIFVFCHHPIHNTFYDTTVDYSEGLGDGRTGTIFDGDPQIVLINGHLHSPNAEPRSIWQDRGFTALNITPMNEATQWEEGYINANGDFSCSPDGANLYFGGIVVEAEGSKVTVTNLSGRSNNMTANANIEIKELDQTWTFDVKDSSTFKYTDSRYASGKSPEFDSFGEVSIVSQSDSSVTFNFDQAHMPGLAIGEVDPFVGEAVYAYRMELFNLDENTSFIYKTYSDFFKYEEDWSPKLTRTIKNLKPGTNYMLRINAVGNFQKPSATFIESAPFKTTGSGAVATPKMAYDLKFNGNMNNDAMGGPAVEMVGTANYVQGRKDGTWAIVFDQNNFIKLDGNSSTQGLLHYNQSFSLAFWVNVRSVNPSADYGAIASSKFRKNNNNMGFMITATGSDKKIKLRGATAVADRYFDTDGDESVSIGSYLPESWVHVAVTFDNCENKISMYCNGELTNVLDADLLGGLGSNFWSTLVGQSYLEGSTNASRAYLNGGRMWNNKTFGADVYMQDFVMENRVISASEIAAMADKTENGKTYAMVSAAPLSDIGEDVEFTFSIRNAENVLTVEAEFEIDGSLLAGKGVEPLSGFTTMGEILWRYIGGGMWQGTVTLAYKAGDDEGFTSGEPAAIAKLVFVPKAKGDAKLALTNIKVSRLDSESKMTHYQDCVIEIGEATTNMDQRAFSKYDLNKDNVVDALDLGILLLYVGFDSDSPDWESLIKVNDSRGKPVTAKMCDVNSDGVIDMLDLLDLFIHYTK